MFVTEQIASEVLSLPMFPEITQAALTSVLVALKSFD
jgi:dTDP-4-amino-4,6-dideoxygalactose transaminase